MNNLPKIWEQMPSKFQIVTQVGQPLKLYGSNNGVFYHNDGRLCTRHHFIDATISQSLFDNVKKGVLTIKELN